MAEGLVGQRSRQVSLQKLPSFLPVRSETDLTARLPDYGPLNIKNYERFKRKLKAIFNEEWALEQSARKTTETSLSDFAKLRQLGSGSFGIVFLVKHESTRDLYALKCVDMETVVKNRQVENLKTEKVMLSCINHPFTLYLVSSFKDNNYVYFVLPWVEGGDLHSHLSTIGQGHEGHARFYASQVILALEYLHFLDFVYRDLKPENILLDRTGYLKLSDFGFTKRLKRQPRTYTLCGTPEYLAPEIILNKGYGKAVDFWALGCFIYELVEGRTPFVAREAGLIYEKVVSRSYKTPKKFSPELKDLIDNLLQVDLSKRYGNLRNGVEDIKGHKWLATVNWLATLNRRVEPPYKPLIHPPDLEQTAELRMPKHSDKHKDRFTKDFADF